MAGYIPAIVIDPEFIIIGDQRFTDWPVSKDLNRRFQKSVSKDYVSLQDGVIARTVIQSNPYDNSKISSIDVLVSQDGRLPHQFGRAVDWQIDEMPISPIYIGNDREVFDPNMSDADFDAKVSKPGSINRKFYFTLLHDYPSGKINSIMIQEYKATNYYNDHSSVESKGDRDKFVEKGFKEAAGKALFNFFVIAITALLVLAAVAGLIFWIYLQFR